MVILQKSGGVDLNPLPFLLPDAELFSAILDSHSDAIWLIDFAKSQVHWMASPANKKKYALPERPTMEFWRNNLHPADKHYAVSGFEHALKDPTVINYEHEYRFLGTDQTFYIIRDTIRFFRDSNGQVLRVLGSWRDVTEDRLKESKLEALSHLMEEERLKLKRIVMLSNTIVWEIDHTTGKLTWVTGERTIAEFGFDKLNYTLRDWFENIHDDDRSRVVLNFERATASETIFFDRYRVIKQDKSIAHVIAHGTFFRNESGKAIKSIGSWVDITRESNRERMLEKTIKQQRILNQQLRQREEKLASAEEELRQINVQLSVNLQQLQEREFILNQSQKLAKIGSWEYHLNRKEMFWSDEMYNIYGVNHSFNINDLKEIYPLFDEQSSSLIREAYRNMARYQNLPFDITARLNTPLGYKKWVRITAYPILQDQKLQRIVGLTYDITYFKEAEERLKTSEEKFANAFRNNPDLVIILREDDAMIVDANERIESVLGYTRQEVIGNKATDIKFFANPEDSIRFFSDYKASGKVEVECPWLTKEGKPILVIISSNRLEIEGSHYMLSVIRDVSEKRYAEERFRKAFDLNPDLTFIFRADDRVLVEVNSNLVKLTGYTREEVLGKSSIAFDLWANAVDRNHYYKILAHQDRIILESTFLKKGGHSFLGIISAQRIKLHGEDHILTVVRDITERKLIEQNLMQSEANLNATVNNTKFMVWSVNPTGNIIMCNTSFIAHMKNTYGIRVNEGQQLEADEHHNPEATKFLSRWMTQYERALIGESFTLEEQRDGRYFRFSLSPIRGTDRITGVTIFGEDITERMEIEGRIRENEAKLEAIMNNTDLSIWSVDTQFKITTCNEVLKQQMTEIFGADFVVGKSFAEVVSGYLPDAIIEYWLTLYKRAFTGESILDEFKFEKAYFQSSVHPIIENEKVVGASVYTRNITELKQKAEELIEANKKIGDLKLMALRSVMNPHFTFNALNSIQYFIAKNDRKNAINYLSTFSKLIRGVLTHSVYNKIKLTDELELLRHYVDLEMVRFENKFEFKLAIDPALDLENIEIPSLLVQPYVENAILHGLHNKKTRGFLSITVRIDGDRVLFEVMDNGVGRKESRRIQVQNFPRHKSMGTILTEERLSLINERANVSFNIEDLTDETGNAAGTRVKIWVRF